VNLLVYRGAEREGRRLTLPAGDRRLRHLAEILGLKAGGRLRVGCLHGSKGWARLLEDPDPARPCPLELEAEEGGVDSPARPPRDLLLALPRPPALRRILQLAPQLGLERIFLVRSARVEKSYLHSPLLSSGEWREHLLLGLEQAGHTRLPLVLLFERLRPFVTEALPALLPAGGLRLLPHPGAAAGLAAWRGRVAGRPCCMAVGPEGGWLEGEVELLGAAGFATLGLGPSILRVEAAVQRLAAQLDLLEDLEGASPAATSGHESTPADGEGGAA